MTNIRSVMASLMILAILGLSIMTIGASPPIPDEQTVTVDLNAMEFAAIFPASVGDITAMETAVESARSGPLQPTERSTAPTIFRLSDRAINGICESGSIREAWKLPYAYTAILRNRIFRTRPAIVLLA